jgi:hypothetical protein
MKRETTDPVSLLCELAEASGDEFQGTDLNTRSGAPLSILIEAGAVGPGDLSLTVTCRACDRDHPAAVEFDGARGRYMYFCPEAGEVEADRADLNTLRYNPGWLIDWLVAEFPIVPPVRRRALVPGNVWHLGDARCGETLLTVILARRVSSQVVLDKVAAELAALPPADLGVVVTSSSNVTTRVSLPFGYRFLDLREVMREPWFTLDRAKLGFWVRAMRTGTGKQAQRRPGRPSDKALVERFYTERRRCGTPVVSISAEARAIAQRFTDRFPDRAPPHLATIRKHIPRETT